MTRRRSSRRSRGTRLVLFGLVAAVGLFAGSGCGGNTPTGVDEGHFPLLTPKTEDKVTFTIAWPDTDAATEGPLVTRGVHSIRVRMTNESTDTLFGETILVRPSGEKGASTATVEHLPLGSARMIATAYASADGTGTPLASAQYPMVFSAYGANYSPRFTVNATRANLDIHDTSGVVDPIVSLGVQKTSLLIPTLVEPGGALVLVPTGLQFHWKSLTPTVATFTDDGVATGIMQGIVDLEVTLNAGATDPGGLTLPTKMYVLLPGTDFRDVFFASQFSR